MYKNNTKMYLGAAGGGPRGGGGRSGRLRRRRIEGGEEAHGMGEEEAHGVGHVFFCLSPLRPGGLY